MHNFAPPLGYGELTVEQGPRPLNLLRQFLTEDVTDVRRQVILLKLGCACCLPLLLSCQLFELELGVPVEAINHGFDLLHGLKGLLLAVLEGGCHRVCFLIPAFRQVLNLEIAVVLRALFVAGRHYRGH